MKNRYAVSIQFLFLGFSVLVLAIPGLLMSGCATSLDHYPEIYESLENKNYSHTVSLIEQAREDNRYEMKDRVLYSLELGLALHYARSYEQSNEHLTFADGYITELYTRRISEIGFSFLTNDNQLPYPGEPYEDIYLNVFKALNFAAMNDKDAVFVEVRKLDEKLSYMERRYKDLAENYQSASRQELGDTIDLSQAEQQPNFEPGSTQFHTSAIGRYLGYITRLEAEQMDGARIDLERMQEAFLNQPAIYDFPFPQVPPREKLAADQTRINFIALLGRGPEKKQVEERFKYGDLYVKLAFPILEPGSTSISRIEILHNNKNLTTLQKLEDVNQVAENVFALSAPLIYSKAIVRSIAKSVISREIRGSVDHPLFSLAMLVAHDISEQADLRTTRLLPAEFHSGYLIMPAGEEITLTVKFYSGNSLVDVKKITETFNRGELNIVQLNKLL